MCTLSLFAFRSKTVICTELIYGSRDFCLLKNLLLLDSPNSQDVDSVFIGRWWMIFKPDDELLATQLYGVFVQLNMFMYISVTHRWRNLYSDAGTVAFWRVCLAHKIWRRECCCQQDGPYGYWGGNSLSWLIFPSVKLHVTSMCIMVKALSVRGDYPNKGKEQAPRVTMALVDDIAICWW
jgi:hypothetical protein